jgi:nucleotide-binding universal stress UspA family protein
MIEIRRILCPIDFSETSRHALEHALAIARWYDSEIVALHVIDLPMLPPLPILSAVADPVPVPDSDRWKQAEEELRAWLERRRSGLKTDVVIDQGQAAAIILDVATSRQADLVVMGTHGLTGFERFMLGSVTEKVLRRATCPVMTVPPASQTAAIVPYKRLVCPVDFSDSSLAALQFAFSIAEEADAKLTILHVFEWPPDDDVLTQRFDVPAYRRAVEEETCGRLEALVPDEVRVWCTPSTKVAHGKPYREILQVAANEGTDLIVIGVRGRNAVGLTVFGSTTNQVVRRASCPVLTLKQ